jgi:sigma-E factor negative regulatory protein RseA
MMANAEANEPNSDWAALSSMADGEAASDAQARCLAMWAQHADARARWRDYQLIGDVLRSSELARDGAHDAAFLASLRERLQREPAVHAATAAMAVVVPRRRKWAVPIAAAAGVVVVVGATLALRTSAPPSAGQTLALRGGVQPVVASAPAAAMETVAQTANGRLIRDARLDRYFAAHRQSANGAALQMPGAGVRNVDTIVLEDR